MKADSTVKTDAAVHAHLEPDWVNLARWAAVALVGTLALVACALGWRRLDGALVTPLEPGSLAAVGLVVAMAAALARLALHGANAPARGGPIDDLIAGGLSVSVLTVGIALSLPGSGGVGLAALWIALALEEAWVWTPRFTRMLKRRRSRVDPIESEDSDAPNDNSTLPSPSTAMEIDAADRMPSAEVTQQLTRGRTARGADVLSGWLRAPLEAGQRTASVHVAFCPPFSRAPHATVEQRDGPKARIKTVQLLPYGVRFDLKLADPAAESTDVVLHFSATTSDR